MLMRWLTANCGDLAKFYFESLDMAGALDLSDVCFKEVALDGSLLLDDDHMMTIFNTLENSKFFFTSSILTQTTTNYFLSLK
jgi:hypothetical protein